MGCLKRVHKIELNCLKGLIKLGRSGRVSCKTNRRSMGRPALSPEARDNQLVAIAVDLAEQQLRDGTATPTVINHYLKLGSSKERLEIERLKCENELLRTKVETMKSAKRSEEVYEQALRAMRSYSGITDDKDERDYDEDDDYYDDY